MYRDHAELPHVIAGLKTALGCAVNDAALLDGSFPHVNASTLTSGGTHIIYLSTISCVDEGLPTSECPLKLEVSFNGIDVHVALNY